jgi:tripartite-type tricarboxylate transporter receptor subunit TctC
MNRLGWIMGGVAASALLAVGAAKAQDASKFYADKTLTYYVGLSAGGGYDQNARLVARYISKYIPGNPTVVTRNMPGGGGLVMTNFVANVAPKDGLHIAVPQRGVPFEPLLGSDIHA